MNLPMGFALHLRKVRKVKKLTSTLEVKGKGVSVSNAEKSGFEPSAPSAPVLVPLDTPFVEGCRYRWARAVEVGTHLDLYVQDANGPWRRTMGVLVAAGDGINRVGGIHAALG
jgi:hypothetical protein